MVASSLRFWDVWLASESNKKMNEHRRLVTIVCSKICSGIMSIPVGRGSTYCFTVVHVSVSLGFDVTPKGNFFGRHVLCFLGHLHLIFAKYLTFALKVKLAVTAFFIRMGFP